MFQKALRQVEKIREGQYELSSRYAHLRIQNGVTGGTPDWTVPPKLQSIFHNVPLLNQNDLIDLRLRGHHVLHSSEQGTHAVEGWLSVATSGRVY